MRYDKKEVLSLMVFSDENEDECCRLISKQQRQELRTFQKAHFDRMPSIIAKITLKEHNKIRNKEWKTVCFRALL